MGAVISGEVDISVSFSQMAVGRIRQSILAQVDGGTVNNALPVALVWMGQGNATSVWDALLFETWVTPSTDAPFLSNLTSSWLIIRSHLESYYVG